MSFTMKQCFLKARYKCWNKALFADHNPPCGFLPEYGLEVWAGGNGEGQTWGNKQQDKVWTEEEKADNKRG